MWGVKNIYIQLQSLDDSKFKVIKRDIPSTRMELSLATGASLNVMKRVVGKRYTLKEF